MIVNHLPLQPQAHTFPPSRSQGKPTRTFVSTGAGVNVDAFRILFLVVTVIAALSIVAAALIRPFPAGTRHDEM